MIRSKVYFDYSSAAYKLLIIKEEGQRRWCLHAGPNGHPLWSEIKEGEFYEPFLNLHHMEAEELLKSLAEALQVIGITSDIRIGELAAIRNHLTDMRQLVFKDKVKELK